MKPQNISKQETTDGGSSRHVPGHFTRLSLTLLNPQSYATPFSIYAEITSKSLAPNPCMSFSGPKGCQNPHIVRPKRVSSPKLGFECAHLCAPES